MVMLVGENKIQIFENSEFGAIRSVFIGGDPYFVGKDVAEALGYKDTADALQAHVDDEDKRHVKVGEIPTLKTSNYGAYLVNESGLYSLILSSKLPTAKNFKRWVTSEVLPSIRKHGGYIAGQESMSGDELMARAVLFAQSKIDELESKNKQLLDKIQTDKPKVEFAEAVGSCKGTISVGHFANILFDTYGIKLGRNKLFKWMKENRILKKDSTPFQSFLNKGWFEVIEIPIPQLGKFTFVTRITPKGQQCLFHKIAQSFSGGDIG